MIIGKSKDPVSLRKIPLKIWKLKDEIRQTIEYYKEKCPEQLAELYKYYQVNPSKLPESNQEEQEEGAEVIDINSESSEESVSQEKCLEIRGKIKRIIPLENCSYAELFLFDMNMDSILLFSQSPFDPGQSVVIQFDIDRGFTLHAEVDYIKNVGLKSRIITPHPPIYRVRCHWVLERTGDRSLLRKFLSSIEEDVQQKQPVSEAPVENDPFAQETDFDLGDLEE